MEYEFKGTDVTRVTVEHEDLVLVPGETVEILHHNDYISELVEQKILVEKK